MLSSTACVAVDASGGAITYDGRRLVRRDDGCSGAPGLISVSCAPRPPSARRSASPAQGDGGSATFDGAGWDEPLDFDPVVEAASVPVSCASRIVLPGWRLPRRCDDVRRQLLDDATERWTRVSRIKDGLLCDAVVLHRCGLQTNQYLVLRRLRPGRRRRCSSRRATSSSTLSCVSSHFCVAVDIKGFALTYHGHGWSQPVLAAKTGLFRVSCSSRSLCAATGNSGNATIFDGSTWTETDLTR